MIYADNAATTKLSPVALAAMTPYFTEDYGNPSSLYNLATHSKAALDRARADVALCLNAQPEEIFFTSGGTESDNWALRGVAEALNKKGKASPDLRRGTPRYSSHSPMDEKAGV